MKAVYDPALVALSIVVAIFASYTALRVANRMIGAGRSASRMWLCSAAVVVGTGIWSMHFIGMLALSMPMTVTYDLGLTLLSMVLPILVAGTALHIVERWGVGWRPTLGAGLSLGLGIVLMHYTGMAAMEMPGVEIGYDPWLVAASVGIAIGAATAAVWLAFRNVAPWQAVSAAIVMGLAISGMHYTAMAAAHFTMSDKATHSSELILATDGLAVAVAWATVVLLLFSLQTAYFDRKFSMLSKREAEVLEQSERRYRALFGNITGIAAITDRSGALLYEASSAWNLLGHRSHELVGRRLEELVPTSSVDDVRRLYAAVLRRPSECASAEFPLVHRDGHCRHFKAFAQNMLHDPAVGGIILNLHDITDLKAREASFRLLFEANPVPMWVFDSESLRFLAVNEAAVSHYGYSREQFLAMTTLDIRPPREREQMRRTIEGFSGAYDSERTWIHRKADGSEIEVSTYARSVPHNGKPAILVASIDVTERRRAEEALRETKSFLDAVVENIPSMVFVKEVVAGRYVLWNKAGERLIGMASADVLGKTDRELFPPEHAEGYIATDRQALQSGQLLVIQDEPVQAQAGVRLLRTQKIALKDTKGDPQYVLAISDDVTESRAIERMKSEFVATVSHELRTPLTSIAGSLGLMAGGKAGELSERASRLIAIAYANCQRLVRLVNDMLDIEKIKSGKLEFSLVEVSLDGVVQRAVEACHAFAREHGVSVRFAAEHCPWIFADPDRITQIVTNLLSNAIKFSPCGGTVRVCVGLEAGSAHLSVSDDGPGIPVNFRHRIFGRFVQANGSDARQAGGSGLGLAIVKELVERHGGKVWFETETGIGTTFHVEVPAIAGPDSLAVSRDELAMTIGAT